MDLHEELINTSELEFGEDYKTNYLEQYKLYVELADRISNRRQVANSFFLTLNTVILGFFGYFHFGATIASDFYFLVSIAGIVNCYTWYRIIKSYKGMNSGKFKVIHEIEKNLPLSPFHAEWEILRRGQDPKIYLPFTKGEIIIPWIFLLLHFIVFLRAIPWIKLRSLVVFAG